MSKSKKVDRPGPSEAQAAFRARQITEAAQRQALRDKVASGPAPPLNTRRRKRPPGSVWTHMPNKFVACISHGMKAQLQRQARLNRVNLAELGIAILARVATDDEFCRNVTQAYRASIKPADPGFSELSGVERSEFVQRQLDLLAKISRPIIPPPPASERIRP